MRFGVFDFETTGLPLHRRAALHKQPRAIEIGGIITDGKIILREMNFLINPRMPLEAIITKITGITDAMLRGQPEWIEIAPQVAEFFDEADAVISHNLGFDKFIAECEQARLQQTLADINWPALEICSVEETQHIAGFPLKLEKLYEMGVGEVIQTHRAIDDVKMLHAVLQSYGIYDAWSREQ